MSEITEAVTAETAVLTALYDRAYRAAWAEVERVGGFHRASLISWAQGSYRMANQIMSLRGVGIDRERFMDEAKIAKYATMNAEALAANYAAKVEAKAAGMTDVKVSRMDASGSFVVTGAKAGHAIEIRQSVVTKVSNKGTWFCQFPALVYIDGHKSTEKALKAL
jgi:hypothetical protein